MKEEMLVAKSTWELMINNKIQVYEIEIIKGTKVIHEEAVAFPAYFIEFISQSRKQEGKTIRTRMENYAVQLEDICKQTEEMVQQSLQWEIYEQKNN